MTVVYFFYGFIAAVVLVFIILSAIYFHLKQSRKNTPKVKGYLDLIPDLTEQQRATVQEIRRVFLPKVDGIRQDMRLRRAELAELLFAEPADRTKIYALAEQIIGRQSELEYEVIEHILEEKDLLSASQKRRFYEIIVEQFSSGGLGVHDVKTVKKTDHSS